MQIYAIELTSRCNLRCSYCPQPTMQRTKEHMPLKLFEKALDYPFGMNVVVGHQFGETLLHPDLIRIIQLCHERGLAFGFSTNTLFLDMAYLKKLIDAGLSWLVISFHSPRRSKAWVEKIQKAFPDFPVLTSLLDVKHDWAGQVNSKIVTRFTNQGDCIFHAYDFITISAQGDILACCLDVEGQSRIASLFELTPQEFARLSNHTWFELCKQCPMRGDAQDLEARYATLKDMAQQFHTYRQHVFQTTVHSSPTTDN